MAEKICSLVAAVLLLCGMLTLPASASAYAYLVDKVDIIGSADYSALCDDITDAAERSGVNIAVVVTDLGQKEDDSNRRAFAEDYYDVHFASSRGCAILVIDIDPETLLEYNYIYLQDVGYDVYNGSIADVYSNMTAAMESGGISAGVRSFAKDLYDIADGADISGADSTAAAFKGVLSDLENKFTESQERELTALLTDTAQDIQCNVGVVITDDLKGKSDRAYADDFLDGTFGVGSGAVVLLYNDDRSNMNYTDWISANGRGTDLYGGRTDDIFDAVYSGSLGVKKDIYPASDYEESIRNFCRYLSNHKTTSYTDGYVTDFDGLDGLNIAADVVNWVYFLAVPVMIGIVVSLTVTVMVTKGYTKKKPVSAAVYLDSARTRFLNKSDAFVREYTTHVRISSSSSSHSGSHRSGGGGHRSGRSGGGGRRR